MKRPSPNQFFLDAPEVEASPSQLVAAERRRYEQLSLAAGEDAVTQARMALSRRGSTTRNDFAVMVALGFLAIVCREIGIEFRAVLKQLSRKNQHTGDPAWKLASQARRYAAYLAHVEVGVTQIDIARVFKTSDAAVSKGCRKVENWRDSDPLIDGLLNGAAAELIKKTLSAGTATSTDATAKDART
jgi:hypothetical protein